MDDPNATDGFEFSALQVPDFARLTDYIGLWCIDHHAFASLWQIVSTPGYLQAHLAQQPPRLHAVTEKVSGPKGQLIALLKIQGLMMKGQSSLGGTSTVQVRKEIRQAVADQEIAGIMIASDTPGGLVSGTDLLAQEIKTARRVKPVRGHIDGQTASAGVWVQSQTEWLTASSPTDTVGSIGTVVTVQDLSAAAEKEGIKTLVFSTGPLKGMGAPGSKITEEQAAHIQSLVDATQVYFDAAVRSGRNLSAKQLAAVKHGGVLLANDAKDAGLIDGIMSLDKALSDFSQALKTGESGNQRRNFESGAADIVGSLPMISARLPMLSRDLPSQKDKELAPEAV